METLLATTAQASFTFVGLFYLALTINSRTREFWFSEKLHSRYAYINLLFLILPGFIALSGLIPSPSKAIAIWPFTSIFLVILYWLLFRDLVRLKKELRSKKILLYEERFDSIDSARSNLYLLLFTSVFGIGAYLFFSDVVVFANSIFGIGLFLIIMLSIVPVHVFMSTNSPNNASVKLTKKTSQRSKSVKKLSNRTKRNKK